MVVKTNGSNVMEIHSDLAIFHGAISAWMSDGGDMVLQLNSGIAITILGRIGNTITIIL
jgi:hypothetical protein